LKAKLNAILCRTFNLLPDEHRAPADKFVTLCPEDAKEKFKSVKENGLNEYGWTYLCNASLFLSDDSVSSVKIFYLGDAQGDYVPFYKDKGIFIYFGSFSKTPEGLTERTGSATLELYNKDGKKISTERTTLTVLGKNSDAVRNYVLPRKITVAPTTN
jgi:hypothetical protein